ncbi:hypothetical protein DCC35_12840 [Mangrovivirga cuniculi]|uniref:Uncharacterized protein n=1 Tax=Mangrovivirga cuniculi TaxID=2715131 RepID=A0A4D7JHR7_9BACT|nr:hypothetical protein DCC35_12840 [Mangrovivirga cuniculi]
MEKDLKKNIIRIFCDISILLCGLWIINILLLDVESHYLAPLSILIILPLIISLTLLKNSIFNLNKSPIIKLLNILGGFIMTLPLILFVFGKLGRFDWWTFAMVGIAQIFLIGQSIYLFLSKK